ncbi:PepSY domain-containing protein [Brachybacterium sp. UNK5269]|uniref:PepSY domain-containing protein n=1 Tax=Brachybacterium sp. UNK5269 TaxID=3408576 RepID=UPI003BAFD03F
MASTITRSRVRAAALGALVISLAAGCGAGEQQPAGPADGATAENTDAGPNSGSAASDAGGDDSAASDAGGDGQTGSAVPDAPAGAALPASADLATEQLPVPAEEAVELAVQTVGGGRPISVEIDHDDDAWEWEIEVALDGREHDLDIDATTGEVTQHDQDDDDDPQEPAVDVTAPLPYAEAIEIALGEAPGRVSGWQLDSDDGRIRYQVDIEKSEGGDDVEVEIDVETREVRVDD